MPIVALPPHNTERWWMLYTVNGLSHRMMMRTGDGALPATVVSTFAGILTRITPEINEIVPTGLERALRGSDVRLPFAWTGAASYGLGNADASFIRAESISFTGRSTAGHKARMFLFGYKLGSNGDYRSTGAESAAIASVVSFLNGAVGAFLAIDGLQPTYHDYGNIGLNDHWVKKLR